MQAELAINAVTSLELTMHDVLDGMEDFSSQFGFQDFAGCLEILAIEPPTTATALPSKLVTPVKLALVAG